MLVIPLADARAVELAGGKGANLGELTRAGFRVPRGFVLTTEAYRVAASAAGVDPLEPSSAGDRLRAAEVPESIATATREAYAAMGQAAVAVRSSATAEDLPGASFAGQQDTYLNVTGIDAVLDAVRRCWASLWNERAVAYRAANGVDPRGVTLAVVVQSMVAASAAGVLFTADPLTGRRHRAVIDAIADLGEKLVSGAVDPDHYVVDTLSPRVLERRPAGGTPVLADTELLALAALGARIEQHFGAPQDIEFAFDAGRALWVVQSRPITTVYPLPEGAPDASRDLRVYFSANVFQGYFEPLTPMGVQFFDLLGTAVYRTFGGRVPDTLAGPSALAEAGMRLYVDVTAVVRDPLGRRLFEGLTSVGEARTSAIVAQFGSDPRLALVPTPPARTVGRIVRGLQRVGVPAAAFRVLRSPRPTRERFRREIEQIARIPLPRDATANQRLDAFERLLLTSVPAMLPRLLGIMVPAMLSFGLGSRVLEGRARSDELQTVTRGAPHNPTTEMDLALWALAVRVRADRPSLEALLQRSPPSLAAEYVAAELPPVLQKGLGEFLARYGFRCIGEIDIGVKRWSEDPEHIVGALANYARLDDAALAPDAQFARGEREATAMVSTLIGRVHGPRRLLTRVVLHRIRELIGTRELPKFEIIRLLATPSRELLLPVGTELAQRGRIPQPDDIFFLRLPEARRAVAGEDLCDLVRQRRATFERERTRRHLPRVLLSDGTDAEAAFVTPGTGVRGSPASPGVVTGVARVVTSPRGAHLEPGEILVAPSTDPGWTPLFLTAGGLVMEMGGMLSHGAVVAREYGIPAVVGVTGATERIVTGQRVTVDGSAGTVTLLN